MKLARQLAVAAGLALAVAAPLSAQAAKPAAKQQQPAAKHETKATLRSEAKIKEKDARKTALAEVPNGKVTKHDIAREDGKVVYTYDIRAQGKTGYEAVQVDAVSGQVVKHEHMEPKTIAKKTDSKLKSAKKT